MSIEAIVALFDSGLVLGPGNATEEEIFQSLRAAAEKAMLDAGSPPDHPLDDRIGRVVARRIWLLGHPEAVPESGLPPIEQEIQEVLA
jgi:hypothetical protein